MIGLMTKYFPFIMQNIYQLNKMGFIDNTKCDYNTTIKHRNVGIRYQNLSFEVMIY